MEKQVIFNFDGKCILTSSNNGAYSQVTNTKRNAYIILKQAHECRRTALSCKVANRLRLRCTEHLVFHILNSLYGNTNAEDKEKASASRYKSSAWQHNNFHIHTTPPTSALSMCLRTELYFAPAQERLY